MILNFANPYESVHQENVGMITHYLWRHRETQQVVRYLAIATDTTDDDHWCNGVLYHPLNDEHSIDFCYEDVFKSRFEFLLDHEILALGLELK